MQYEDPVYGNFQLPNVVAGLIKTQKFQRLKGIHQGGAIIIAEPAVTLTRYEHSIGVSILIGMLGGDLQEQVAGLLHDISHTAFSHLIDYVLQVEGEDYHEQVYEKYVSDPEIVAVLSAYGLNYREFLDLDRYTILEYPLPGLCADRIDYTLRDLFHLGMCSNEEIRQFLPGLIVSKGRVMVKSKEHADWFKQKFEYLNKACFNGLQSQLSNQFMSSLVKQYYREGKINLDDFDGTDIEFISRIEDISGEPIRTMYHAWLQDPNQVVPVQFKPRHVLPEIVS